MSMTLLPVQTQASVQGTLFCTPFSPPPLPQYGLFGSTLSGEHSAVKEPELGFRPPWDLGPFRH